MVMVMILYNLDIVDFVHAVLKTRSYSAWMMSVVHELPLKNKERSTNVEAYII